jgi:hypothetical protein
MGAAKRRGSFEERKAQALTRDREYLSNYCETDEDKALLAELGDQELRAAIKDFKQQELAVELEARKLTRDEAIRVSDVERKNKRARLEGKRLN